jgi:hypothetical protein
LAARLAPAAGDGAGTVMAQLALFCPVDSAALAARAKAGRYVSRAIWRELWEAGRQHGLARGAPLPRNQYGAAQPTPEAARILRAYYTSTAHLHAPMNRDDADIFEAGRRFGRAQARPPRVLDAHVGRVLDASPSVL